VRSLPQSLLIILAAGLILRTLVVSFHQRPLISDEREYNQLAYNLSTQGSYTYDKTPTAYRPVGYPAFVAALYTLKYSPLMVKYLQVLLDIAIALLLFLLLEGFSLHIRLLTAGAWAFFPPAMLYANFLMSETLFTFLLVGGMYFLTTIDDRPPQTLFLTGLILGVLLLIKPNVILFLLGAGFMAQRLKINRRQVGMVSIGVLLVTLPWLLRNYVQLDTPSLSTNGGINLLIGNNPNTTGAYAINFPPEAIARAANEVEVDGMATRYAVWYILDEPGRFIINGAKKIGHLLSSEGGLLVWSFHDDPETASIRYAEKYAAIPLGLILLLNVPSMLIVLLGIPGFFSFPKGRLWWLILIVFLTWIATHAITFGGSRFHFPLMPFLIISAAFFLSNAREAWRNLSFPSKAFAGVSLLLCLAVWIYEAITVMNA
jgi:hypothetical protein